MPVLNRDRLVGAFYGHSLGDVLGMPYEFARKKLPYSDLIQTVTYNSQFHGARTTALGQCSDDTEMTGALVYALWTSLHAMAINGGHNVPQPCFDIETSRTSFRQFFIDSSIMEYMKFANSSSFIGKNTRYLFYGIKTLPTYLKRRQLLTDDVQPNGSLMRALPLVFLRNENFVAMDAHVTNPGPVNGAMTLMYVHLVRNIIFGMDGRSAANRAVGYVLARFPGDQNVINMINSVNPDVPLPDVTGKDKGWARHALHIAIVAACRTFSNFSEGIRWIISLGGDTDTNGAIAGAVLGAIFGLAEMKNDPATAANITILDACDCSTGNYPKIPHFTHVGMMKNVEGIIDGMHSWNLNIKDDIFLAV